MDPALSRSSDEHADLFTKILPGHYVLSPSQYRAVSDLFFRGSAFSALTITNLPDADRMELCELLLEEMFQIGSTGALFEHEVRHAVSDLLTPGNILMPATTLANCADLESLIAHELYHRHTILRTPGLGQALQAELDEHTTALLGKLAKSGETMLYFSGSVYADNGTHIDPTEILIHAHQTERRTGQFVTDWHQDQFAKEVQVVFLQCAPKAWNLSLALYAQCKQEAKVFLPKYLDASRGAVVEISARQPGASAGRMVSLEPRWSVQAAELGPESASFSAVIDAVTAAILQPQSERAARISDPLSLRRMYPQQCLFHISPDGRRIAMSVSAGDRFEEYRTQSWMVTNGRVQVAYTPDGLLLESQQIVDTGVFAKVAKRSVSYFKSGDSLVASAYDAHMNESVVVRINLLSLGRFASAYNQRSAEIILRDGIPLVCDAEGALSGEKLAMVDTPTFSPDGSEVFFVTRLSSGKRALISCRWDDLDLKFSDPQVFDGLDTVGEPVCSPAVAVDGSAIFVALKTDAGYRSLKIPRALSVP